MKTIKVFLATVIAALVLVPAAAQDQASHQHQSEKDQRATEELTKATIQKLDHENSKITLKHEAIKSMGMPAMTMVFVVEDKSLFKGLAVGDKVRFKLQKNGSVVVIAGIEKAHIVER